MATGLAPELAVRQEKTMSALMVAMIACEQPGCDATFTIRADLDATRKAANEWDNGWRSFPSIHMDYCPEHQ